MKNILKISMLLLAFSALVFSACKKDELDTTALTDFAPGIASITPANNSKVDQGNFDVKVKFISGSISTLASTTVVLSDEAGTELKSATKSLSGTSDSIVISGADFNAASLPLGKYKLVVTVTDVKGKSQTKNSQFEIFILPKVGIIGSATPGGWDADTDMTDIGNGIFEVVLTLVDGEAKFRADDAWTVNWGSVDFPSGIGTQDGANIKVSAGTWRITFSPSTGSYNFTSAVTYASKATELYLLGSFNNFEGEQYKFNLVADYTWELGEILIKPGALFKFSEGPAFMGKSWGDNESDGKAEEFGKNIVFAAPQGEAYYKVTFNDKTLRYQFDFLKYPSIGIIGSATPGGWDAETVMTNLGNGSFEITLDLLAGEAKFRANNSWDTNWGATDFPEGVGVLNGGNIPVTAGRYKVTFTPGTGAYKFVADAGVQSVGVIGSATPKGWDADTEMTKNADGTYSAVVGLDNGEVKFRANGTWDLNWGATGFPSGTGVVGGANIPVTKGIYLITFDPATANYSFEPASIGVIGSATPGGWDSDTNMSETATVGEVTLNLTLVAGEAKFRVNDGWAFNWGGTGFPSGTATPGGANIPVTAGTYTVTFNVNTGAYSFN